MPIQVACQCGAKLHVRDEAVGKLVKCPKCQAVMTVPKPEHAPADDGFQIVEEKPAEAPATSKCPYCGGEVQPTAILCRHCKHRLKGVESPGASRSCPTCGMENLGNVDSCPKCGEMLGGRTPRGLAPARPRSRPRDLIMEGHLRAIAVWCRIYGVLIGGVGLLLLFLGVIAAGGRSKEGGTVLAVMFFVMIILAGIGVAVFLLGHFLAKYSNVARIITAILVILTIGLNAFGLLFALAAAGSTRGAGNSVGVALISCVLNVSFWVAVCWALFNSRTSAICTDTYRRQVVMTSSQTPPTFASPFFWVPFILFAVSCALNALGRQATDFSRFN